MTDKLQIARLVERLQESREYPTSGTTQVCYTINEKGERVSVATGKITQLRNPDGPAAAALLRSQAEELERLRGALRPLAAMPKSTEYEVSDCLHRSPAEELRRRAELTERRDSEIAAARAALGER